MDELPGYTQTQQKDFIAFVRSLVECESPSDDPASTTRFAELLADSLRGMAKVRLLPGGKFGKHLRAEFALPGRKKQGQILVLGHGDTVWPIGTLKSMPWREKDGRLWGPGVFDMKAGVAMFIQAMRGLRELDVPISRKVVLQVNSDEEVGSPSSRPYTEKEARLSAAALLLEPAAGLDGKLKTARKGGGVVHLTVTGVASHAGLDFEAGASAILELARQLERTAAFTDLARGITVNAGVIRGGTRSNVVAAEAHAEIDMRMVRKSDGEKLERRFRALKAVDPRCSLTVAGGVNRPPMERTPGTVKLFRLARAISAELGIETGETMVGGGSDGNFTSALGTPTLDGLGAVGEGAHAVNESVLIRRLADRTALLGRLVERI
ncbi:MAG: M20 family metallopeptidase [Acidobacteria bacterium]|nr:M20 family metallopeptidase [Acidobacteriota bacterium]